MACRITHEEKVKNKVYFLQKENMERLYKLRPQFMYFFKLLQTLTLLLPTTNTIV